MRWSTRKAKPTTTTTDSWTAGFTGRGVTPGTVDAPMAQPLPQEVMGEFAHLHRLIEQQIDRMLPGLEDNHGHALDEWLASQLASAQEALHEYVARQDAIADGLIGDAQVRAQRARDRYARHTERMHTLAAHAAELRHDLTHGRPVAPDALVSGGVSSAAQGIPVSKSVESPH
ncbi:MAG: hypothetical protein WAV90_07655 [Gordonia amarae]